MSEFPRNWWEAQERVCTIMPNARKEGAWVVSLTSTRFKKDGSVGYRHSEVFGASQNLDANEANRWAKALLETGKPPPSAPSSPPSSASPAP